jgi:hypothetical protein
MFNFCGEKKSSESFSRQATPKATNVPTSQQKKQPVTGRYEKHEFPGFYYSFLDNLPCERK